jgi:hypothetical protein
MPGRPPNLRPIPLRSIGIRLLAPRGNYMTNPDAAPGGQKSITWVSCQMGKQIDPEKPKTPIEPEFIHRTAVTVMRNPNFVEFSNPCDRFK